ncbi:MAG: redoxin domain-containing protein [Methylophilaceae bacterium]|uniref:redoxin domain-containing protein n=1 Tax=Methylovorus sp. MM2 TaxID=1848038 RepID=UPI0007DF78C0|nr:redoxin domain-containing protein [Methylovorus sp. MM2]OAM52143.1 peroxiredoxin [Methylovorus sp. MM2]
MSQTRKNKLSLGEPAPWFKCRGQTNNQFGFDTIAGRYVVLSFFESAASNSGIEFIKKLKTLNTLFDDTNLCFFGVSTNPDDEKLKRVQDRVPGIRYFWDFDHAVSKLYGVIQDDASYQHLTYVLDPMLRIVAIFPDVSEPNSFQQLRDFLHALPKIAPAFISQPQAPVLTIPYIFEPELCKALIDYYARQGGEDSGFMREVNGRTVGVIDYAHKRRSDCSIEDERLRNACMVRIHDRLVPEIKKAFQFSVTRMERYIIACYDGSEEAHFRAHRDNTTKGTAHRRFAVSLFLNSGEYEGGHLRFPEFGSGLYSAPVGGAVVFSCSLLHEATIVTKGQRYMFLPFLYDDAASKIRQENAQFLDAGAPPIRNDVEV